MDIQENEYLQEECTTLRRLLVAIRRRMYLERPGLELRLARLEEQLVSVRTPFAGPSRG
jgi:hypothetical protein